MPFVANRNPYQPYAPDDEINVNPKRMKGIEGGFLGGSPQGAAPFQPSRPPYAGMPPAESIRASAMSRAIMPQNVGGNFGGPEQSPPIEAKPADFAPKPNAMLDALQSGGKPHVMRIQNGRQPEIEATFGGPGKGDKILMPSTGASFDVPAGADANEVDRGFRGLLRDSQRRQMGPNSDGPTEQDILDRIRMLDMGGGATAQNRMGVFNDMMKERTEGMGRSIEQQKVDALMMQAKADMEKNKAITDRAKLENDPTYRLREQYAKALATTYPDGKYTPDQANAVLNRVRDMEKMITQTRTDGGNNTQKQPSSTNQQTSSSISGADIQDYRRQMLGDTINNLLIDSAAAQNQGKPKLDKLNDIASEIYRQYSAEKNRGESSWFNDPNNTSYLVQELNKTFGEKPLDLELNPYLRSWQGDWGSWGMDNAELGKGILRHILTGSPNRRMTPLSLGDITTYLGRSPSEPLDPKYKKNKTNTPLKP